MKSKTKKAFERYLNALYFDAYSYNQAMEQFEYLTVKSRGAHCSKKHLHNCYHNRELGTLLRRYDSVAFEVSYNEWK